MRFLIDGYNLMHAAGAIRRSTGPAQFRKIRTRFLHELAATLGPIDSYLTTIVFDAANSPPDVSRFESHKGVRIVYAVDSLTADERIEELLEDEANPKDLTVVSSDNRIRAAARRRRAKSLTCDEFLDDLDARKLMEDRKKRGLLLIPSREARPVPSREEKARVDGLNETETEYWLREFGDIENEPEAAEVLNPAPPMINDDEIEKIADEIDAEFKRLFGKRDR